MLGMRGNGNVWLWSPAAHAHYQKIYPYRKLMMILGIVGMVIGFILFISVPIIAMSAHEFNAALPICGFLGVLLIGISCMSCQCGWAAARYHDAQQQGLPPIAVSYNNPMGPQPPYYGPSPYPPYPPQQPLGGQWQPPPSQVSAPAPPQMQYGYPESASPNYAEATKKQ